MLTRPHMEWHLRYDRINCSVCGNFYTRLAGGLRTHMVQEHKIENEAVRDKMFQNSWQLVVYVPPSSTSKIAEAGNLTTRNTIEADCLCSFTKNENSSIVFHKVFALLEGPPMIFLWQRVCNR